MKKVLRIIAIVFASLLALLILIPILFRGRIEETVRQKINENVSATVDWSRFSLSLFRSFPDLSINLHGLSVVGVDDFAGDTLLGLRRFELRANPFSAFRGNVVVSSILLDRPLISVQVLDGGRASYDIAHPTEEVEEEVMEEGEGTSMSLSLESFAVRHGRIYYRDFPGDLHASMEDVNLELGGDFSMAETEVKLNIGISGIDAVLGGVPYMRKGEFGLDLLAAANMEEQRYSMLDNEIRINGLVLGVEGEVLMLEEGAMEMDLDFFTRETAFSTLLSLVPVLYLEDFSSLETSGSLALNGKVRGVMKDSLMPDAQLFLEVKDGFFSYPGLPKDVSDVQIRLLASYDGTDMDGSTVSLERFHLLLGGNPFDIRLELDHPVSDMRVAARLDGVIDFSTLKDIVPLEDMELEGRLMADLEVDTRMSYIEEERYEEVDMDGRLLIEGLDVESAEVPVPVHLSRMELNFSPRFVELAALDLVLGSSDLHLAGRLENFIPYVFTGETVAGQLALTSTLIDANELLPAADTAARDEEQGPGEDAQQAADSTVTSPGLKIPENIAFDLRLDLKEVRYEEILVENVKGSARLREGKAHLDGLSLDIIKGSVQLTGTVDTRPDLTLADVDLDIRDLDIPTAYETFVTVEKLAPMARYCRGGANISLDLKTSLDASFSPVYESLQASGRIFTRDVEFYNMRSFVTLSELFKNEKFRETSPDNLDIRFRIRDGRVMVDPFRISVENSAMVLRGSHGIDMSLDYMLDMNIATVDLGAEARNMILGLNALAAGAGINRPLPEFVKVKAGITGTFQEPRVTPDFGGSLATGKESIKDAVEEKAKEEIRKVEAEVREDVSRKAEEILAEAEEQAGKIMAEARRTGDQLVSEAEKQGQKLVEEADNPLKKIAAREGARELVRQAEKKRGEILQEAQERSDKMLEDARKKAGEL